MKQKLIIAIVLGVLLVVSVVQAFQLNNLKSTLEEGQLSVNKASSSVTPATSGSGSEPAALPSSLKDLPPMVGGC